MPPPRAAAASPPRGNAEMRRQATLAKRSPLGLDCSCTAAGQLCRKLRRPGRRPPLAGAGPVFAMASGRHGRNCEWRPSARNIGDIPGDEAGITLTHKHLRYAYAGCEFDHRNVWDFEPVAQQVADVVAKGDRDTASIPSSI